jgi:hypothetical protein
MAGFHTHMWTRLTSPLEGLLTRGSGELEHAVPIEDHMLFSRYFLTGLDEYKASPIVPTRVGCTGCTVPINLRAPPCGVPRRWALPPRAALHNRPQRGRTIA